MRTWAKGSSSAALLAAGVMALGSGTAVADTTSGTGSIAGGNQVNLPISLPVDISGNAVGVAGDATAGSQGGASVENPGGGTSNRTSGNGSILGGNQVEAPISAPVNACGNALAIFGSSDAGCKGGASVKNSRKGGHGEGGNTTSGEHSVLGGNQIIAPITAPINACGNSAAIFGDSTAGCKGGAKVKNGGPGAGRNTTSGRSSILGGNKVIAPITAPINICGNSAAFFGSAFAGCKGGSSVTTGGKPGHGYHHGHGHPGSTGNDTDGRFGVGSGNQVFAPITLPVNVCGNAAGNASAGCHGGASVENKGHGAGGGNRTSGRSSILGGNQVIAPITAPINVCGNSAAVFGQAFAGCKGGASVKNAGRGAGGNITSGRSSILGGNQIIAPITAPINICGNSAAVLGRSEAYCKGGASVAGGGVGGGGNRTDGRYSILGGNQVIAPITAPINICGNAAAVLGDAAAGCLGGARVGGHPGHGHGPHKWSKAGTAQRGGLLPALPGVPALAGLKGADSSTRQMSASNLPALPVVGDATGMSGLPSLPGLPGEPSRGRKPGAAADPAPLAPVTGLTSSLPVGGDLGQVAGDLPVGDLPVGDLGLMSAEQPVGLTGMNPGSLAALILGAMFAASATLFATTRRFRLGRK